VISTVRHRFRLDDVYVDFLFQNMKEKMDSYRGRDRDRTARQVIILLKLFHQKPSKFVCFKPPIFAVQWNLGYTSESGLKNLDVELRGTHK